MREHLVDGRRVEEVGAVLDFEFQAMRSLDGEQRQVKLRSPGVWLKRRHRQIGRFDRRQRSILHGEENLEQRRAGGIALGLKDSDDLLERQVLVRVCPQRIRALAATGS